jgi:hypothetical protein
MANDTAGQLEQYCRGCFYMLRGIGQVGKCPECGQEFDLSDPKTWARYPRRQRMWRILRWPAYGMLALLVLATGLVGWFDWGWRAEQTAINWVRDHG